MSDHRVEKHPARESLRQHLRAATRERHADLDGAFTGMETASDPAAYHVFLCLNEACYRRIDPPLRASVLFSRVPGLDFSSRRAALAADMAALALRPIAGPPFPFTTLTLSEAVGVAYVLEGSRIGGRLILRRLRESGRETVWPRLATSFLATSTGPENFGAFMERLDEMLDSPAEMAAAADAANAAFGFFLETLRIAEATPRGGGVN